LFYYNYKLQEWAQSEEQQLFIIRDILKDCNQSGALTAATGLFSPAPPPYNQINTGELGETEPDYQVYPDC
jgi:hypothetical protein